MLRMLCRNKVANFPKWKRGFDSHSKAQREAGLALEHLWRNADDAKEVFFVFAVANKRKAQAFVNAPGAAEAAEKYGVLEGDIWFVK